MMSFITSRDTKINEIIKGHNLVSIDEINISKFLKSRSVVFAFIATGIGMFVCTFFASFMSVEFKDIYGVPDEKMGFYFACLSGPYMLSAVANPIFFSNVPKKLQFAMSVILASLAFGFLGPSNLLNLPQSIYLVVLGLVIIGFSQALLFVNSVPEIMDSFQLEYKIIIGYDKQFDNKLND